MNNKLAILCLSILILFPIIIFGQPKQITVSGVIKPNWSNQIQLGDSITTITENGVFQIEITLENPKFITLKYEYKTVDVFLIPEDSLHLKCIGKDFPDNLTFKGKYSELNSFLLKQKKEINESYKYLDDNKSLLYSLTAEDYVQKIDSIKQSHFSNLYALTKNKTGIYQWFIKRNEIDIRFQFDRVKLVYPARYFRNTGGKVKVESDYFNSLAINAFNDPDFLRVKSYHRFINTYLDVRTAGKYKFTNYLLYPIKLDGVPRYNAIINLKAHEQITDYFLTQELKKVMVCGINNLGNMLDRYKEDCKNPSLKEAVLRLYGENLKSRESPSEIKIYKKIGDIELEAHIFYPKDFKSKNTYTGYVFFHGGAWDEGSPQWGYSNCKKYASKGMVAISIEYRLKNLHGVRISDCVADAKDAISWIRENAKELGIDKNKLIVEGFSSGGHLALSTAIFNQNKNDFEFSFQPNALILKSASYSVKHFSNMNQEEGESISPQDHVKSNMVPTIMFHGTNDYIVSYKEFTAFVNRMEELNNDFTYHTFKYAGHFDLFNDENDKVMSEMIEKFLITNGFMTE